MGSCAPIPMPAADGETPSSGWMQITTTSPAKKRKNRPAGTPDPDAEVVSLSPRTLLEPCRHVCEICSQVFRREQNLVLHRRGHNLPWKLKKRDAAAPSKKRVFVCPEPSCRYHHPAHALRDVTAIRKHFHRKHGACRKWVCASCSKAYAVLGDYKAHVKTCGTRGGHSCCHCGRVFPRFRVEEFVEHQSTCSAGRPQAGVRADMSSASVCGVAASLPELVAPTARSPCRSRPSVDIVIGAVAVHSPASQEFHRFLDQRPTPPGGGPQNLELQLMPASSYAAATHSPQAPISRADNDVATELRLSIGSCCGDNRGSEFRQPPFTAHMVEPRAQARR